MASTKDHLSAPRPGMRRHKTRHPFQAYTSIRERQKADSKKKKETLYLGIATQIDPNDKNLLHVGLASHDGTYSIDFYSAKMKLKGSSQDSDSGISGTSTPANAEGYDSGSDNTTPVSREELPAYLASFVLNKLKKYEEDHRYKYVGAGVSSRTHSLSPQLPSLLWRELDIVPLVLPEEPEKVRLRTRGRRHLVDVDEDADSLARKALKQFGPAHQPRLLVGTYWNMVEVDSNERIKLTLKEDYIDTVNPETTWKATLKYAESLKEKDVKIAFFNSTPQGGGVALMRHALIRFLRTLGVKASWYVPKPKPEVFTITKGNHNILQAVADEDARLTPEQIEQLDSWAKDNAERYWMAEDDPLASRENGGADVIIVDDPQMPSLVKIAKELDPDRPVIFRSHIQVRADLADKEGSPQSEVWNWVWSNVKQADLFISHPVREFVPKTVAPAKVGYLPATTDWLDGLNKTMDKWDIDYYMHEFKVECYKNFMSTLDWPDRKFIVQIARFDPSKGIPDVLASYAELRRSYMKDTPLQDIPQLVIAGHGAVDDTDTQRIYDLTLDDIEKNYAELKDDIVIMRVGPTDQILNALMSCAHVALQLSTREGFEVKVSEALHKGKPVIATKAGGIPLQVEDGKSGLLVEPGDYEKVAENLYKLFTDEEMYQGMSEYAATHVSDEVSTVGNALSWLYMADALHSGEDLQPNSRWINDMAREKVGIYYQPGEARLPRSKHLDLRGDETRGNKTE